MVSHLARHTVRETQRDSGDSVQVKEVRSHCLGGIVYPSWFTIEGKMPSCDHEDFLKPI